MNICFVATIEYPGRLQYLPSGEARRETFRDGVRRVLPLLKHAQKRGHKVILVIPMIESLDRYEVYDHVPIYRVGATNWTPLKSSLYLSGSSLVVKTLNKLRKLVKAYDIDIIHIYNPTLICGVPGWIAAKLCHKPFVLDISDIVPYLQVEAGQTSPSSLLTKLGLLVQNNLPSRADMVTATNFITQVLISNGMPPERISVIPAGVDISAFHPGIDGKEIRGRYHLGNSVVILYQGEMSGVVGIDTLLEAMFRVSQKNKDIKLLLVGYHVNRKVEFDQDKEIISFKRKAEQLGIKDRVIFTGPQPHETVPYFIAASDICVNPVPYTITHRAASPAKIFEYMAVGKPVVATAMESVEGAIIDGETGLLTKPEGKDIAEKVLWLAGDSGTRHRMGRSARKKAVAEFAWDKIGDRVIDVLRQAIETQVR